MNIKEKILKGEIFIYPTDTIYGIGCNAFNKKSVAKIRRIKQRDSKPFSVIAPSLTWIKENCIPTGNLKKYLPGKYTLILKKKNKKLLNWVSSKGTLGVRVPKCSFTGHIQKAKVPFITTSVNLSGEKPAVKISDIPKEILDKADVVIDKGSLTGRPSTLIVNGKKVKR